MTKTNSFISRNGRVLGHATEMERDLLEKNQSALPERHALDCALNSREKDVLSFLQNR